MTKITQIDPPKKTTRVQFSTGKEMFTPNWDKKSSSEQKMERVAERNSMGQKMTPIGRGTLKKR